MSQERFQGFFETSRYLSLKNHLYNYRLRKRAISKVLGAQPRERILEVGSGISPIAASFEGVVYSEISFSALSALKDMLPHSQFTVCDATRLPFKAGKFSHVICSEVLEHLPDDERAISEIAQALRPGGSLLLTVPHRKFYFAPDDAFVGHYRRYELKELESRLRNNGFEIVRVEKVLGPLDKILMRLAVFFYRTVTVLSSSKDCHHDSVGTVPKQSVDSPLGLLFKWANDILVGLAWLDARIWPRSMSTILLIEAHKKGV